MATGLQIGHRTISADDLLPLLSRYQMLPQLIGEQLIDEAIAPIQCTPNEITQCCQQWYAQYGFSTESEQRHWREQQHLSTKDVEQLATRRLKVEKFKYSTWETRLDSYFLSRKSQLDRVIYSLIRVVDMGVAQELYFRLEEGEQTFAELACNYSQGPEAQTGGMIGPVEIGTLQPALARLITRNPVGRTSLPITWGNEVVLVRLEHLIPAQLNDAMRQQLLDELFQNWLCEQIRQQTTLVRLMT
jgi:parvulin-like peptidyl-prolyl isomerase